MEYGHGGDIYRNSGVELDFSVNVNPLGMPFFVWEAAQRSISFCHRYPDSNCGALKEKMKELTGLATESMIFGNGAAELIFRLIQTVKPRKAVIVAPAFLEYETALRAFGAECAIFLLRESESFFLNTGRYLEFLKHEKPDMIFLCTPANPTGSMIRRTDLETILEYCKKNGIFAVMDECFIDFLPEEESDGCLGILKEWNWEKGETKGTLFLLRAFTKIYAMAGLRLGYGFCSDPEVIFEMEKTWQPWTASVPAQEAGLAALCDERISFLNKTRQIVKEERGYLADGLTKAGFRVFPSKANFLLLKDYRTVSESCLYDFFLKRGILIRSCKNYRQLDERFYRICVRNHEENREFLEILREYE